MDERMKIRKRFLDQYERAFRNNQFCFTDFLAPADSSELLGMVQRGEIPASYVTLDGGYEGAERVIARFGSDAEYGWEEPFDLVILKISPLNEKFGENLSHRDYLGSLMALQVERDTIGDIRVRGKEAWIFVLDRMASYITDNLESVRHTHVRVEKVQALPEDADVHLEECEMIVPSERIDVIVSRLVNASRSKTAELFRTQKIMVNGRLMENYSGQLKEGDVLSIRGWGKVIYDGVTARTRKDNIRIHLRKYV
ncbi:MAG: YlmH/Sll1252 family protein [Eubacteriales bacterium]|nr:YlmH/Sll1252 family protein [Eubacteriales bacterium]